MLLTEIFATESYEIDVQEREDGETVHSFETAKGTLVSVIVRASNMNGESEDETESNLAFTMIESWIKMKGYKDMSDSKISSMFEKLGSLSYLEAEIDFDGKSGDDEAIIESVIDIMKGEIVDSSPDIITFVSDDEPQIKLLDKMSKMLGKDYKVYRYEKGQFLLFKPAVATSIKSLVSDTAGSDAELKDNVKEKSASVLPEIDKAIRTLLRSPDSKDYDDDQIVFALKGFEFNDKDALDEYLAATGKDYERWLRGRVAKLRK